MMRFGYYIVVIFVCWPVVDVSMATIENEHAPLMPNFAYKSTRNQHYMNLNTGDEDLTYSDLETAIESREKFFRQLREHGVPSDVAQMIVPRGMTIGDLWGKNKEKNEIQHTSSADTENDSDSTNSGFDPWTIVWYIGSFGGLIAFFLVVSCSEWCCLKKRNNSLNNTNLSNGQSRPCNGLERVRNANRGTNCDTPPPSYHLFAPPSYDSINYEEKINKLGIFVVPVHGSNFIETQNLRGGSAVGEQVPPPEYTTITMPPT